MAPWAPMLAAVIAVGFLSLMDAFMKQASLAAGAYSAALLRAGFAALIVVPIWLFRGGKWPATPVLKLHLLRGVVSAFMALSFFYAITKLPLAEAIAISFIAPLIALYLAAIFLGETIRAQSIIASLLGLAGSLIIIHGRLGAEQYDAEALKGLAAVLFSASLYACNFIIIRKQALAAKPLEVASFHAGVSAAVLALAAPWFLVIPAVPVLREIGVAAALTVCGSLSLTWAYARAEAQRLVPMEYSGFLWAALLGWLFFAEKVEAQTIMGVALIIGGCWIAARGGKAQAAKGA